jgi:hypothetical protein
MMTFGIDELVYELCLMDCWNLRVCPDSGFRVYRAVEIDTCLQSFGI